MKAKYYLSLLVVGLCLSGIAATLQPIPGYMDAAYYYVGGQQLALGKGFSEPFIWNYLDNPAGIPHPSHTYWMPLPSLLAAAGMKLTGDMGYVSARLPFVILAALISPLTALICYRFTNQVATSIIAGGFALFSGFYLVFSTATESFSLYMLLGGLFIIIISLQPKNKWIIYINCLILGVLAGLMHLTRADGILWLFGGFVIGGWWIYRAFQAGENTQRGNKLIMLGTGFICIMAGYLVIMAPWYYRNYDIYGTLFSPGGSKTLWLINYDQTFVLDAAQINFSNWVSAGWQHHLQARAAALSLNLKTLLGVETEVFQLPLLIIGAWAMRRDFRVIFTVMMWLCTFGVMTVIFPYSGSRGGFFHSGAALQPVVWVLSAKGFEFLLMLGVKRRHWNIINAQKILGGGLVLLSLFVTIFLYQQRVIGGDWRHPIWSVTWSQYQRVESELENLGTKPDEVICINDPPSYYAATQRSAIVIPDGDEKTLVDAARRYRGSILVLEKDHPVGLNNLYNNPNLAPDLAFLIDLDGIKIFRIKNIE